MKFIGDDCRMYTGSVASIVGACWDTISCIEAKEGEYAFKCYTLKGIFGV